MTCFVTCLGITEWGSGKDSKALNAYALCVLVMWMFKQAEGVNMIKLVFEQCQCVY